jgi:5'(3')-deoxyribonucleotidase
MSVPIFLDLDGVFADFYTRSTEAIGAEWETVHPSVAWAALEAIPHFFLQLEVLPGSLRIYQALKHHGDKLEVLTAIPRPTGNLATAREDKKAWVARYMSAKLKVNTITGGVNKYKFATPGAVLIDDLERNLVEWEKHGGIGVLHTDVESTLKKLKDLGLT